MLIFYKDNRRRK